MHCNIYSSHNPMRQVYIHIFTDEETEAGRDGVTCSKSPASGATEPEF